MSYSRLNQNYGNYIPLSSDYFMGINPSTITVNNRSQLCSGLDDFTSFLWRGYDAFLNFGAFIINSNDLQFYNGPTFSNEYTNPQFESASGQLMGVNFKNQTFKFKIGVYWINITDYQKLLKFLDPYEINYLSFGFNKKYSYLVKLGNISDSTRTIVGKENNEYMYYTELTLTWELQGPNCVRAIAPISWEYGEDSGNNRKYYYWKYQDIDSSEYVGETFLKTPLYLPISFGIDWLRYRTIVSVYYMFNRNMMFFNNPDLSNFPSTQTIINISNAFISNNNTYNFIILTNTTIAFATYNTYSSGGTIVYQNSQWIDDNYKEIIVNAQTRCLITNYSTELFNLLYYPLIDDDETDLEIIGYIYKKTSDTGTIWQQYTLYDNALFNISLQNLSVTYGNFSPSSISDQFIFNLIYDSETGLIYLELGNDTRKLLTLLTQASSGENLVSSFTSRKFYFPEAGSNLTIPQSLILLSINDDTVWKLNSNDLTPLVYARTNVI